MRLPRGQTKVQGMAVLIADQVDLRRKAAAAAAERVVRRLARIVFFPPPLQQRAARTIVPSTHHNSPSISFASRKALCSRASMPSSVPSAVHRLNQCQTDWYGPNSSGRSRQGAPVRLIHKMPSSTVRKQQRGLPVLLAGENSPSMHSHCSLVNRCRAILGSFVSYLKTVWHASQNKKIPVFRQSLDPAD